MELLIMAAGMGSRFGGLKQIEPFGPNDEFLIDYSVYDAKKAGFDKVVFIIKEENYEVFKETIGARVEPHIPVEYAFQKMDDIPDFVKIPENREKPWGTAQSIYCAKEYLTDKFVVINADDFYGFDTFRVAKEFLDNAQSKEYSTIGYKVINTMTENGSVKRGVLLFEGDKLTKIIECTIEKVDDKIIASPLSGDEPFEISEDTLVSMNFLTFDASIFDYIESKMDEFFKENENNLEKCEFLIPDIMNQANQEGYATIKVLSTNATWYGVTYQDDKEYVKESINKLIENKEYPENLWR